MKLLFLMLLALLSGTDVRAEDQPSPEVLENIEFFLMMDSLGDDQPAAQEIDKEKEKV